MVEPAGIKTVQQVIRDRLRKCTDGASARFKDAILPIYGSTETGGPFQIGSSILLKIGKQPVLLTAAHNIDWNKSTSLYIGRSALKEPLRLTFFTSDKPHGDRDKDTYDFAVANISDNLVAKLGGVKYVTEAEISWSVPSTKGRVYACFGYPNSKNKKIDQKNKKITPRFGRYTSRAIRPLALLKKLKVSGNDHLFVAFNKKYSRDEAGNRVNSIAMPGFSGGAVIDLGNFSDRDDLVGECNPLLAGLFIEFHSEHKSIVATRLSTILSGLAQQRIGEQLFGRSGATTIRGFARPSAGS
jgi:hypothetical protein